MNIGLAYEAPPNKVRQVIVGVLDHHPKVLKTLPYRIRLIEFGDFAITYQAIFWHNNYTHHPQILADLNNDLWYALRRNGINIPFPIRDVRMAHEERQSARTGKAAYQQEMLELMGRVPILEPLSKAERVTLTERVSLLLFGTGEDVVVKDAPGDSMYIIHRGSCNVLDGAGKKIAEPLTAGNFFGEMSLLTGEPRTATIRATEDTSVVRIGKEAFADILSNNTRIIDSLGEALAERQKELENGSDLPETETAQTNPWVIRIRRFLGI